VERIHNRIKREKKKTKNEQRKKREQKKDRNIKYKTHHAARKLEQPINRTEIEVRERTDTTISSGRGSVSSI
jgi:hypothetical protein